MSARPRGICPCLTDSSRRAWRLRGPSTSSQALGSPVLTAEWRSAVRSYHGLSMRAPSGGARPPPCPARHESRCRELGAHVTFELASQPPLGEHPELRWRGHGVVALLTFRGRSGLSSVAAAPVLSATGRARVLAGTCCGSSLRRSSSDRGEALSLRALDLRLPDD